MCNVPRRTAGGERRATMHRKSTLAMCLLVAFFTLSPGTVSAHATTSGALAKIPGVRIPIVLAPGNGAITFVGTPPGAPPVARPDVIAQSHIQVNYQGFSTSARTAFQAAVNYWAATLSTPITITVDAVFGDLGHNQNGNLILGGAGPGEFFRDSPGVPLAHTWYPKALANRFAGFDLDPGHSDIQAAFTSN